MKCPRCDKENIEVMAKSPVDHVWDVYICKDCFFSWRSTEDINVLPKFKLNEAQIMKMDVIPPVYSGH